MNWRNLMLDEYKKEWERIAAKLLEQYLDFFNEYGLDFERMESAFTLDELQEYVEADISKRANKQEREAYHVKMLTQLARLYANTVFLMLRNSFNRGIVQNREQLYNNAIDRLKARYNYQTAYPCSKGKSTTPGPKRRGGGGSTGGRRSTSGARATSSSRSTSNVSKRINA